MDILQSLWSWAMTPFRKPTPVFYVDGNTRIQILPARDDQ